MTRLPLFARAKNDWPYVPVVVRIVVAYNPEKWIVAQADFRLRALEEIERILAAAPAAPLPILFADWPLDDFGRLLLSDRSQFPRLALRLPRMPSAEIQRMWTGNDGEFLLKQSVAFVETVQRMYEREGRLMANAEILDYGAGWGRLTRLFMRYVPEEQIRTCDAVQKSVDLFNSLGFSMKSKLVDEILESLPYDAGSFDLIWLFSILTHLSARAGEAVMRQLKRVLKDDGLLAITVRPRIYWASRPEIMAVHEKEGFAYIPHGGRPDYGDASMTLDHIRRAWPGWYIVETALNEVDPYQVIVFMKKS